MSVLKQPVNKKSPHKHVVYKHTAPNGKSYIGITNHYTRRCRQHQKESLCSIFHRAILKYGWDNFKHEFLAVGLTLEAANHFEEFYIRTHDTVSPNGYNLKTGGKVGKSNPITNEKISNSNMGRIFSEETRAKISKSNTGKKHTPEARAKMSESQKGKVISPEVRIKISAGMKGIFRSETHKQNNSFPARKAQFESEYSYYLSNISELPTDTIFTATELGNLLGDSCSAYTVRKRIRNGYFPNSYKGNVTLIPITDVIAYYEKYKVIYLPD